MAARRVFFDITTSSCWTGPPVGIVRVERELARRAASRCADFKGYCVFDPERGEFRAVTDRAAQLMLTGEAVLAPLPPDLATARRSPRQYLVGKLFAFSICHDGLARKVSDAILRLISKPKDRLEASARYIPRHEAIADAIPLAKNDTIASCGLDWIEKDMDAIGAAKARGGFRYVSVCYDLIPWKFPQWVLEGPGRNFARWYEQLARTADIVVAISESAANDFRTFCAEAHISPPRIEVVRLGHDFRVDDAEPVNLPAELNGARFVLFVSTIDPRKGQALMYQVWERLIESMAIPPDVKLVFVGRESALVRDLLHELRNNKITRDRILLLANIPDSTLKTLYQQCLFTVFPSLYEGYGLPVVESLAYGKLCIASDRGAIPEVASGLTVMLDPRDFRAWVETVARFINDPALRAEHEARIRAQFRVPTWEDAADAFFRALT